MTEKDEGTAVALLDAAEAAFATSGIDGASLRSIMRSAGANTAAVHYHYGSRDELARAVLDRVLAPLQARRLALLDELLAKPVEDSPSVHELVEALIRPDFETVVEVGGRNPGGTRLIGAIYAQPSEFVKANVEASFGPVAERFMPHFMAAVPGLDEIELAWRVRWVVFGILGALLSDEETTTTAHSLGAELARVVAVIAAAVAAPTSRETTND